MCSNIELCSESVRGPDQLQLVANIWFTLFLKLRSVALDTDDVGPARSFISLGVACVTCSSDCAFAVTQEHISLPESYVHAETHFFVELDVLSAEPYLNSDRQELLGLRSPHPQQRDARSPTADSVRKVSTGSNQSCCDCFSSAHQQRAAARMLHVRPTAETSFCTPEASR